RDLLGGGCAYNHRELYRSGGITSPNALVIGQIGRGKSALVKTFLWRESVFGRHAWVVDPKGEYGRLAAAVGVEPIRLAPGGPIRLNPLDGTSDQRRQAELLASLASASLARPLLPGERTACELAVQSVHQRGRAAVIPAVVDAL